MVKGRKEEIDIIWNFIMLDEIHLMWWISSNKMNFIMKGGDPLLGVLAKI